MLERAILVDPKNPYLYNSYANMLMDKGDVVKAKENFEKALSLSKTSKERACFLMNFAVLNKNNGEIKEAISKLNDGLKLSRELNDKESEAKYLNILGSCYNNTGNTGDLLQAVFYFDEALSIINSLLDIDNNESIQKKYKSLQANILTNKGIAFKNSFRISGKTDEIDNAIILLTRAIDIEESLGNKPFLGRHYGNLAEAYRQKEDVPSSKKYLAKCANIFNEHGSLKEKLTSRINLALHESEFGDNADAIKEFQSILQENNLDNFPKLKTITLVNCGIALIKANQKEPAEKLLNNALSLAVPHKFAYEIDVIRQALSETK
ncbi:TPA: tetratricopeptide repeat protein [Aeromonas veronii]